MPGSSKHGCNTQLKITKSRMKIGWAVRCDWMGVHISWYMLCFISTLWLMQNYCSYEDAEERKIGYWVVYLTFAY